MSKKSFFAVALFTVAVAVNLVGLAPVYAQEKSIPKDLRFAFEGIARNRMIEELQKIPSQTYSEKHGPQQNAIRGWLGEKLNQATAMSITVSFWIDSPQKKFILNCPRATWSQVSSQKWRMLFDIDASIPVAGKLHTPSSNFFGTLAVTSTIEITATLEGTRITYQATILKLDVAQQGFSFTNDIVKLANSTLRKGVRQAVDSDIKPMLKRELNAALLAMCTSNSGDIRKYLGIQTGASSSSSNMTSSTYPLAGTWVSGNNTLAISEDGRFTLYVANTGKKSYYYTKTTSGITARDSNGKETAISIRWDGPDTIHWTSPNGPRVYKRSK